MASSLFVVAAAKYFLASCRCWRLMPRNRETVKSRAMTRRMKTQRLMTRVSTFRDVVVSVVVLNDRSSSLPPELSPPRSKKFQQNLGQKLGLAARKASALF